VLLFGKCAFLVEIEQVARHSNSMVSYRHFLDVIVAVTRCSVVVLSTKHPHQAVVSERHSVVRLLAVTELLTFIWLFNGSLGMFFRFESQSFDEFFLSFFTHLVPTLSQIFGTLQAF
jgi:hypothetical protein